MAPGATRFRGQLLKAVGSSPTLGLRRAHQATSPPRSRLPEVTPVARHHTRSTSVSSRHVAAGHGVAGYNCPPEPLNTYPHETRHTAALHRDTVTVPGNDP